MAKRVLIVDDGGFMRTLLIDILSSEGYEVVGEATDGQMGVDMFESLRPDIVTMDVNMPKLDGKAALEAILRIEPTAKVVMLTTAGQDSVIKQTLLTGARDFIIKPFKKHQVVTTLNRIVKESGSPQSFLEELVAWHELGEMLVRNQLISPEDLLERREEVKRGDQLNLIDALMASGMVEEQDIRDTLDDGHKEVSMAFLMMKTKVVTMAQLRCAFVMIRKNSKKLGFTLVEQGFCTKEQVSESMKLVPPSRFTMST